MTERSRPVRIDERFSTAWRSLAQIGPPLAGPEFLPIRLAMVCASALPANGAGLCVFSQTIRVPIGASNDHATAAERLQFTLGQGPCLDAHATGKPVVADAQNMAERWPTFFSEMMARTPYRAVAALPLTDGLTGLGVLDLYFDDPAAAAALSLPETEWLTSRVTAALVHPTSRTVDPVGDVPGWLGGASVQARSRVPMAMGMISVQARVSFPDALAMLRAHAYSVSRSVDEIAADVVDRVLPLEQLDLSGND